MNLLTLLAPVALMAASGPFLVQPYLQLGDTPTASPSESLELLWQAESNIGTWRVEMKTSANFKPVAAPASRLVALGRRHFVYRASLTPLKPGEHFDYRVLFNDQPVFSASGHARVAPNAPFKFAVFADCGADTSGQKKVAIETGKFNPDFVFIPGDIVYYFGLAHEYHNKFFPIYNADRADPKLGAPLLRSIPFLASVGNHDVGGRDLGLHPDGLAYFYYWSLPLNGLASFVRPGFKGSPEHQQVVLDAAGNAFPRMSNYSFDYGNSHWLVLDSNPDVEWSSPELKAWVAKELASAKNATWRFVAFHHPPFNSSKAHGGDEHMRVLAKTFEDGAVDVVFSGHVHNYQRTYPLKFQLSDYDAKSKHAPGTWKLDRTFDGREKTNPSGVIYLITGAGGAFLYDTSQGADQKQWQEFTTAFVSNTHSFTGVEIDGKKATFHQIDDNGKPVDTFTITK